MYKIAVDIGGTNIKIAVFNTDLDMLAHESIKTPDNKKTLIIDTVHDLIAKYIQHYQLERPHIGISTAGVVDTERKAIIYAGPTITNYNGTDFQQHLGDLSDHITVHNDVDAALLGELVLHKYPESHIFCLTLGTGIGGAFYTQQHGLYTGARYHANEIGYLLYRSSDGLTYEQRASTSALKALIKAYGLDANISVPALFDLAEADDKQSVQLLNDWGNAVAEGIAQIQIIYDPDLILIGGGISSQGDRLIQYIEPHIQHYLPHGYGGARLQTTRTKNHAALYGALVE